MLLLCAAAIAGFLIAVPSPIDPAAWRPPEAPLLAGVLAPNEELRGCRLIATGKVHGGEDVDVDAQGRVYTGTADGRIIRVTLAGDGHDAVEVFADTGGRPLGLDFDRTTGELIVADAASGLLAIDPEGAVTVLSRGAEGVPFGFTDDVDVSRDGEKIYFSDASARFGISDYLYDLFEARPHGRLLVYDRTANTTTVLLDSAYFANGVALSRDEDFVLVSETYRYRIQRCWLPGSPRAGQCEIFADNLPGFADGIAADGEGTFWVAVFTVRDTLMDGLHPWPFLKSVMARLPRSMWPKPKPYGLVLAFDEQGNVVRSLHDPGGERVRTITSVEPHDGALYLGNLYGDYLARWSE